MNDMLFKVGDLVTTEEEKEISTIVSRFIYPSGAYYYEICRNNRPNVVKGEFELKLYKGKTMTYKTHNPEVGERINFNSKALQKVIKSRNMDFIEFIQRFSSVHELNTGRQVNLQSETEYFWLKNIYSGTQNSMYERTIKTVCVVLNISIGSKEYKDVFEPENSIKTYSVTTFVRELIIIIKNIKATNHKEAKQKVIDLYENSYPNNKYEIGSIKEIKD